MLGILYFCSMQKPRITAVSYLNTLPFVYGLQQKLGPEEMSLSLDVPSECARKIVAGEVTFGLAPAGVWPLISDRYVKLPYGIGADGVVNSVMLFSRVPMKQITRIWLDQDSRTSVLLIRLLARHHWGIHPEWVDQAAIRAGSAAESLLAIGDKAFALRNEYPYHWDLATEWKQMTGLPFVFAVWVSATTAPAPALKKLTEALMYGAQHIDEAILESTRSFPAGIDLHHYLTHDIRFRLQDDFAAGLATYLKMIREL